MPVSPSGYVDEDENIEILDGGKGDGVIGAMFGKSLKEQLSSSWFWQVDHCRPRSGIDVGLTCFALLVGSFAPTYLSP